MDSLLSFASPQFLIFALAVAAITFVLRTLIEYFISATAKLRLWEDVILPIFPIFIGALLGGPAVSWILPAGTMTVSGGVLWGLAGGALSTILFRTINAILQARVSIVLQPQNTATTPQMPVQPTVDPTQAPVTNTSADPLGRARSPIIKDTQ